MQNSNLQIVGDIAVLNLYGTWYQMGCQYGVLARSRMEDVLCYLDRKLTERGDKREEAADIAEKLYSGYPSHLKSFLKGVDETSGLGFDRVKLCNAAEYVEGLFLCSAMAVWSDYGTGKLVFGRNYDAVNYSEICRDIVVTVFHPEEGIPAATVGYAGEFYCVNGINACGLFLELNNGMPSAGEEIHWELCPSTTSLFNLLFNARTMDDVDRFFNDTRSFSSFIIGVADSREARSYEWCYDGVRRGDRCLDTGLMASANHYVNPAWKFPETDDAHSWNSLSRYRNILDMAERNKGEIGVERMKELMSESIENGGPRHKFTRYQIVAVPEELCLHICLPCYGRWSEIRMGEMF